MQGGRPMVRASENQAIQLNVPEVAIQDAISKHTLARAMSWSSPEITRADHGAVAVFDVFGSETPFRRHRRVSSDAIESSWMSKTQALYSAWSAYRLLE
jgi:hypothetical protein